MTIQVAVLQALIRVAIYARFSTDQQRKESVDDQFRICERTAKALGLTVVAQFSDEGISGGTAERPGYQSMLTAARNGAFDLVLAEDISRLWRSRAEFGPRSAELEDFGVHILTCVGDDTRRDGWMVVTIKLALAEQQRREISYRTFRGMEGLALAGKSTGGRCFGYRDGAIYAPEAEIVSLVFHWRVQGYSLGDIVKGIAVLMPPPRGGEWKRSTIQSILANERYTGAVIWGTTESKGGARDSRLKRHVMRSDGPIVARHDPALAIVSQELYNQVQRGNPNGRLYERAFEDQREFAAVGAAPGASNSQFRNKECA